MSNKIFETLINFMTQKIFDKLVDYLQFKEKEKKNVASGYIDGVYITIYYEEKKFTIIIPDEKLSEEKCREIAKKIIKKIFKLNKNEIKLADIQIKMLSFASGICNYCLIKSITYKCQRCKGYYCSNHRLPENHNCPEERKFRFNMKEKLINKNTPDNDKKSEKIIIVESYCG